MLFRKNDYLCNPFRGHLGVAQLVAHLVRDQEVACSSQVTQTIATEALAEPQVPLFLSLVAVLSQFQRVLTPIKPYSKQLDQGK